MAAELWRALELVGVRRGAGVWWVVCVILLMGCSVRTLETDKVRDLDYELVEEADIPEEMRETIEEYKEEAFSFTYADKGRLYIARGYGKQKTDGYKIQVLELYESENAVVLQTTFLGPEPDEETGNEPSYPYIVIQTEYSDKDVVIE